MESFVYIIVLFVIMIFLSIEFSILGYIPELLHSNNLNTPKYMQKLYVVGDCESCVEYIKYPIRDMQYWIIQHRVSKIENLNVIDDDFQIIIANAIPHHFAGIKNQCLEAQWFIFETIILPNRKVTFNKTLIHNPKSQELELAIKLL